MTAPLAGETVLASHYPKVRVIKKSAVESVTSSIVMQNDDDLTVALDAGKTYWIQLFAGMGGATAGDIRVDWATTGGVAQLTARHCHGPGVSVTDVQDTGTRNAIHDLGTDVLYGTDNIRSGSFTESFLVETTTANAAGTLTLRWAQSGSNATATTVSPSSFMVVTEIDLA